MAQRESTAQERTEKTVISSTLADKHNETLTHVLRLLRAQGVRAHIIKAVNLQLFNDGRPLPGRALKHYAPELVAYSEAGWQIATIVIGQRSDCYLVSLPTADVTAQIVGVDQPNVVADMVLSVAFGRDHAVSPL